MERIVRGGALKPRADIYFLPPVSSAMITSRKGGVSLSWRWRLYLSVSQSLSYPFRQVDDVIGLVRGPQAVARLVPNPSHNGRTSWFWKGSFGRDERFLASSLEARHDPADPMQVPAKGKPGDYARPAVRPRG